MEFGFVQTFVSPGAKWLPKSTRDFLLLRGRLNQQPLIQIEYEYISCKPVFKYRSIVPS
jgi:hypothetical protein